MRFDTPEVRAYKSAFNPTKNIALSKLALKPPILLKSSNGPGEKDDFGLSDVTLSSNGEKNTVVLFVPLAFTGVCTGELCDITAGLGSYTDLNADVIAVSVDSPLLRASGRRRKKSASLWPAI